MSTEEKEVFKDEIRGINAGVIRTFVVGTFAVCSTIVGGIVYIKNTLTLHDYQIKGMEGVNDKQDVMDRELSRDIASNKTDILIIKSKLKYP